MKIRTGFVSNSSSSSFIINTKDIEAIKNQEYSTLDAKEYALDDCKWEDPDQRRKLPEGVDYDNQKKEYNKSVARTIVNYKEALDEVKSDINQAQFISVENILEEYRRPKCSYVNGVWTDFPGEWDYDKYEMSRIIDVKKHISLRFYYMLKKKIDCPKQRRKLYQEFNQIDLEDYSRSDRARKYYNKVASKQSSKVFWKEHIANNIINNMAGSSWCSLYDGDSKILPDYINKYILNMRVSINGLFAGSYKQLETKLREGEYIELEYCDDSRTGAIIEKGIFFNCADDAFIISHH